MRKRPTKAVNVHEMAGILAYGDVNGDKAASREFGISVRTIQRYRSRIKAGAAPELSALVAEKSRAVTEKYSDLLDEVFGLSLEALKVRIATAKDNPMPIEDRALIGAIKIIGDQRTVRDVLVDDEDDEDDDSDGFGAGDHRDAEEAEGTVSRAKAGEAGQAPGKGARSVH